MNEPHHKTCRCRHVESSHDEHGCMWCKCKRYRYCRITSINISNEIVALERSHRLLRALMANDRDKEAS